MAHRGSRAGAPCRRRPTQRRRRGARLLALLVALLLSAAAAQAEPRVLPAQAGDPQPWVRASDLARVLGAAVEARDGRLVMRTPSITLTVFAGSADALIADGVAREGALSAPVRREADGWWLPLDAGAPFGLQRAGPDRIVDAVGRSWALRIASPAAAGTDDPRTQVLEPAPGVVTLELRDGPPEMADRAVWIADLALVPLARPELRAIVDAALRDAGGSRALLLVATSRQDGVSFSGVAVAAEGRSLVPAGARHETLSGRPDAVGPDAPWIAVVWLPPGTRLDLPLRITWEGATAEVVLRR